jgi:hypothetical protein
LVASLDKPHKQRLANKPRCASDENFQTRPV